MENLKKEENAIYLAKPAKIKEIRKGRKIPESVYLIAFIVILTALLFFLMRPFITGYVTSEATYTDNLNLKIENSQSYLWGPEHSGEITSIRVSGKVSNGNTRIYLETEDETLLIYDSENSESFASAITGFILAPTESELLSDSSSDSDSESSDSSEPSNEETPVESEQSDSEPIEEQPIDEVLTEDLTEDSVEPEHTDPVPADIPEEIIEPTETPIEEIIETPINETEEIIEPIEENITEENITSEKTIDINFDDICEETCIIGGLNQTEYNLIIEVDKGAKLNLKKIIYTVKKEVVEAAENVTAEIPIANLTENFTLANLTLVNFTVNYDTIQEDREIQAVIDSIDYNNETNVLNVVFHHESSDIQPIAIISDYSLDYTLGRNESASNENITLTVENWNPSDYFEIKIGQHSQVFGIGEIPEYDVDTSVKDAFGNVQNVIVEFEKPVSKEIEKTIEGKAQKDKVQKGKYNIKIIPEEKIKEIVINDINVNNSINTLISIDTNLSIEGYSQAYAIDPTVMPEFTSANVTVTAVGTVLWKCKDWNFSEQNCYGEWTKLMDIVPGQEYTFELTPEDPALAEGSPPGTFFEGFESGSFATNNWTVTGAWAITPTATYPYAHSGNYYAQSEPYGVVSNITTNISTLGYSNISISFWAMTQSLDPGEYIEASWYNGTAWTQLLNIEDIAAYTQYEYNLTSAANNNPNFRIRFTCVAGSNNEICDLDDINITGKLSNNFPAANLVSPANGNVTTLNSVNFTCNATDDINLKNITFYWNYSGSFVANGTTSISGLFNQSTFARTNLNNSAIRWNCLACDNASQCSWAAANYTVIINASANTAPYNITLNQPLNNTQFNNTQNINFNFTAYDKESATLNCSIYLDGLLNQTNSTTKNATLTNFQINGISYANHNWFVNCSDGSLSNVSTTRIFRINDTINPQVNFTAPTEISGSFISRRNILVNITVSDASSFNITTNVYNASGSLAAGTRFSTLSPQFTNFSVASDGIYYFNSTVYDAVGNNNYTETRNVTIDTIAPVVSIISPTNTSYSNETILVNISASDTNLASRWFFNGTANESYTSPVYRTFSQGSNNLKAWANDSAGNVNSTNVTFFVDSVYPLISIVYPQAISYNHSITALNYTLTELNPSNCWYSLNNGANISVTCGNNITSISSSEGSNTWTVYANDSVGNENKSSVTFNIDTVAPNITLIYPLNNSFLSINTFKINSSVVDLTSNIDLCILEYDIVNVSMAIEGSGSSVHCTRTLLSITDGLHSFSIFASDSANNTAKNGVNYFTVDTIDPQIQFVSPTTESGNYSQNYIIANVTVIDANLDTIIISLYNTTGLINSTSSSVSPAYFNFSSLADGTYYLNATANDSVGKFNSTETKVILIDTTAPSISIISPQNITYSNTNTVSVNISSDGDYIWWNNGTDNLAYTGALDYNFSDGSHILYAYANDTVNNMNSTSVVFSIDSCVPNMTNSSWSDWINVSCSGDNMNQSRFFIEYDSNSCGEIANTTYYEYQLVGPSYVNTSWSDWTNISCLPSSLMNQSRNLTQYDVYGCAANTTFFEYRQTEFCDYCTPALTNSTPTEWVNQGSCLANDTQLQNRSWIEYDSNSCGEIANVTYWEYNITTCDYCTPQLVNTTPTDWINLSCSGTQMNQSRSWIQYDNLSCVPDNITNITHYEYQLVGPTYANTSATDWINISCLSGDLMNQSRNWTQYDVYGCGTNTTFFEYRQTEFCDYCTPVLLNTTPTDWINLSCSGSQMNQSRNWTQYDSLSCVPDNIANQTFFEYQLVGPSYINTSIGDWINISCLPSNLMNQSRNWTQYDSYSCALNSTFYEYRQTESCIYCAPNLVNTSWSDWTNISCSGDNMNQSRFLTQYDLNNCLANQTFYEYQLVGPTYANTSWSDWINISCLFGDVMNQSRNLTQYDSYSCASNSTFIEYQAVEFCDYCTPSLTNTTPTEWANQGSCLSNDTQLQNRSFVEYDLNSCGEIANVTYWEYNITSCDYCTPVLLNTTPTDWINLSCSGSQMNQSRNWTQYDSLSCVPDNIANQTFFEYQLVGPTYANTSWSDWNNISCLPSNTMNQSRNLTQYDIYACAAIQTFYEYRNISYCQYDTIEPVISIVSPTNGAALAAGTSQAWINITTDENTECRYSTNSTFSFNDGIMFSNTNSLNHSFLITGLISGNSYSLYYKCKDISNNINALSIAHAFSVIALPAPPSGGGGGGGCNTNWQCSEWGECINNIQTRECIDLNNCRTNSGKPILSRECIIPNVILPAIPQIPAAPEDIIYETVRSDEVIMQIPSNIETSSMKKSNFGITLTNIIGRELNNIDIMIVTPMPEIRPTKIHPYPTIGWNPVITSLIGGIGIKGEANYSSYLSWRTHPLHYESIPAGGSITANLTITPPLFSTDDKKISFEVLENGKVILDKEIDVEFSNQKFFVVTESDDERTREVYIGYDNSNQPGKEKVTIEFSINQGNKNLVFDYLGPYDIEANGKLFIAQKYLLANKLANQANLTLALKMIEKGKIIAEAETDL